MLRKLLMYIIVIKASCIFLLYNKSMYSQYLLFILNLTLTISRLVQKLEGKSSRKLLNEYQQIRKQYWGRHVWARG